jgi:hypothetical protein
MKAYWGSGRIAPLNSLTSALDGGSGQLHALAALPPGKESLVPTAGSQSRSGRGGEEKNSQPPPGIEP